MNHHINFIETFTKTDHETKPATQTGFQLDCEKSEISATDNWPGKLHAHSNLARMRVSFYALLRIFFDKKELPNLIEQSLVEIKDSSVDQISKSLLVLAGFQKDCLRAHNEFRFNHGVPALKWSAKLTHDAQVWANRLAGTSSFYHDPTARSRDQGENLSYVWPAKRLCDYGERNADCLSCRKFVEDWYNEYKDYDYYTGKAKIRGKVVTHFTQIIWRSTRELGMSTAVANDGTLMVVARYSPVGNWLNEFTENVPPPVK